MGCLFLGYEFYVFTYYHNKDNKHDGRFSEFVTHLKGKLESAFKQDIYMYFDICPHGGLMKTYEVDDFMKKKKSASFISENIYLPNTKIIHQ